jgi:PPP family 3-phenylpropionic acid transporter
LKDRNIPLFKSLYLLVFFADALFTPFVALDLVALNMTSLQKGLILGLLPLGSFLGNLVFSFFTGSFKRNKILLEITSIAQALMILGCALFSNFTLLIISFFFSAFFNSAYFQIEDGTSIVAIKKEKRLFNEIRIFGSIGYCLSLLFTAFALKNITYKILFSISASLFLLTALVLIFLKSYPEEIKPKEAKERSPINRTFILYFIFYVFCIGSQNVEAYLFPLYYSYTGIEDSIYSFCSFLRTIVETVIILLYKPIKKLLKTSKMGLLASAILEILSTMSALLIPSTSNLVSISIAFLFRGLASGLIIISLVEAINEIFGDSKTAKNLNLIRGGMYLFTGIGNFLFTYVLKNISYQYDFLILLAFKMIGLIFLVLSMSKRKKV